jgi:GAF domain-containing protein
MSEPSTQIRFAVLGGGEAELNVFAELQKKPKIRVVGIYDSDPAAIGLEIAEILGISAFKDDAFLASFLEADFVLLPQITTRFRREIEMLGDSGATLVTAGEALRMILEPPAPETPAQPEEGTESLRDLWHHTIEETLESLNRVMDREELLRWLLEIAVRSVGASTGSILLVSEDGRELYVGYAHGLSERVIKRTRMKMGEGIAGSAAQERKARLLTSRFQNPLYGPERERVRIESAVVAPLVHRGEVLGVLNVSTDQGEKVLSEEDLEVIRRLGKRMAAVLHRSRALLRTFDKTKENALRSFLEKLGSSPEGLHEKCVRLSHYLADLVAAESLALYLATEDGGWFVLAGSDHHAPTDGNAQRFRALKGSVARCYLEQRPLRLTEIREEEEEHSRSCFPLTYQRPLGVVVVEFEGSRAREQFENLQAAFLTQVGAFLLEEIKEASVASQFEGLNQLARLAPALLQFPVGEELWREVLRRGVDLVSAERGSLRLLEKGETVRGPYTVGFTRGPVDRWKELDERVIERHGGRERSVALSRMDPEEEVDELGEGFRSLLLVPIPAGGEKRILLVAYNKIPRTPLDSCVFTPFDQDLFGRFAETVSPILSRPEPRPGEAEDWNQVLSQNRARFESTLEQELRRAERYHLGFVLTRVRIRGFSELYDDNFDFLLSEVRRLSAALGRQIRRSDHFEWIEPDGFVILSLERRERVRPLEKRLLGRLATTLARIEQELGRRLPMETGYARFPGDGATASELLSHSEKSLQLQEI